MYSKKLWQFLLAVTSMFGSPSRIKSMKFTFTHERKILEEETSSWVYDLTVMMKKNTAPSVTIPMGGQWRSVGVQLFSLWQRPDTKKWGPLGARSKTTVASLLHSRPQAMYDTMTSQEKALICDILALSVCTRFAWSYSNTLFREPKKGYEHALEDVSIPGLPYLLHTAKLSGKKSMPCVPKKWVSHFLESSRKVTLREVPEPSWQ